MMDLNRAESNTCSFIFRLRVALRLILDYALMISALPLLSCVSHFQKTFFPFDYSDFPFGRCGKSLS